MAAAIVPLHILISDKTKWQPEVSARLVHQLVTNFPRLQLAIKATERQIAWVVGIPSNKAAAIKHAVEAFYLDTQVTKLANGDEDLADHRWKYQWSAARPFIFPFRLVEECHLDPLAPLVTALTSVNPGEEVLYTLDISLATKDYEREVKRMFTPSVGRTIWWGIQGMFLPLTPASPQMMQEDRELRTLASEKVKLPLAEVQLSVIVTAASEDRSLYLATLIDQAFSQFDSDLNVIIPPGDDTYDFVLTPREIATMWHLPTEGSNHRRVVWSKSTPVGLFQAPSAAKKPDYVVLGTSEYIGRHQRVFLAYDDRKTHVNIVGKNGTGKSTLIHSLVYQDILNNKAVGVIDPKGDLITRILASIPPEREKDIILFDVADKAYPIGLNLLAMSPGVSPDELAGRALALIKKFFADDWPGEQTERAFYAVLLTLLYWPGATVVDVSRLFNDDPYRWHVLAQVDDLSALEFWDEYERRGPGDRQRIATPVITRISRFYRDRTLQRIICQSKGLNFRWVIDTNKIFLASLAGLGELEAYTLGALLISKFQLAVMSRTDTPEHQRQPVYLYIDEVQNFTTHSLGTMFSQGRSFGLSLATANQYFSQLPGETLEAVLGNVGTNICFAVGETSARHLAGLMRPEFTTDDLQQLDKYTAVVKMQKEGQTLPAFLLHTLPPLTLPNATAKIERIKNYSRETYGRSANEVDAELRRRYGPSEPQQPGTAPVPTDPTQLQPPLPVNVPPSGDLDLADIWE